MKNGFRKLPTRMKSEQKMSKSGRFSIPLFSNWLFLLQKKKILPVVHLSIPNTEFSIIM